MDHGAQRVNERIKFRRTNLSRARTTAVFPVTNTHHRCECNRQSFMSTVGISFWRRLREGGRHNLPKGIDPFVHMCTQSRLERAGSAKLQTMTLEQALPSNGHSQTRVPRYPYAPYHPAGLASCFVRAGHVVRAWARQAVPGVRRRPAAADRLHGGRRLPHFQRQAGGRQVSQFRHAADHRTARTKGSFLAPGLATPAGRGGGVSVLAFQVSCKAVWYSVMARQIFCCVGAAVIGNLLPVLPRPLPLVLLVRGRWDQESGAGRVAPVWSVTCPKNVTSCCIADIDGDKM